MGYTTWFDGAFQLDKPLTQEHKIYLNNFSNTRRMKRDINIVETISDPIRIAAKLPIGEEGCYFVGGNGYAGQDRDKSIIDYNSPPNYQPGLWCQWVPSDDGTTIVWDGEEKFYNHKKWLEYIIEHFLEPWGYMLSGSCAYQGEDPDDKGEYRILNNKLRHIRY